MGRRTFTLYRVRTADFVGLALHGLTIRSGTAYNDPEEYVFRTLIIVYFLNSNYHRDFYKLGMRRLDIRIYLTTVVSKFESSQMLSDTGEVGCSPRAALAHRLRHAAVLRDT